MTRLFTCLAAGAATLAVAVPAAAQSPYPSPYAYPQQTYPQGQDSISQIINQLLGNRYQANDRYAVERCATAAVAQANAQYHPNRYGQRYGTQGYGYGTPGYGYGNQGYYPAQMRVTAITQVQRRGNGLRVSGLIDSNYGAQPPYGNAYGYRGQGYPNQRYAAQGDLSFRCNVDYRGAVRNVRIGRNQAAYNRGY